MNTEHISSTVLSVRTRWFVLAAAFLGWMFDGLDAFAVLGASGNPQITGLGFRYDVDSRWSYANPTGLPGVMEGFCPPHYADMRSAVEAVARRKFGPGGPFHSDTPGPWKDSEKVRSSAQVHS